MRKALSILLVLALCLGLCACVAQKSQEDNLFTITCKDGSTETMTREQLEDIYSNEIKYKQKYEGAHVYGEGKIHSIEKSIWTSSGKIEAVDIGIDGFTTTLADVPADYAANLSIGDTIVVSGHIECHMTGFVDIVADDYYKQNTNNNDKSKVVYDGLYIAKEKFEFVSKYAGNVNGAGSRKFADEFITELRNALANVDIDYINSNLPQTAAVLQTIQNNITTVADMLVDMGNTNSDANVPQMKQLSKDTIALIDQLFDSELSAYDY